MGNDIQGNRAAFRMKFDINSGTVLLYVLAAAVRDDGAVITWGSPTVFDAQGMQALTAFVSALANTGTTPGSTRIGVKAKAGANELISIANGTLQTALEALVTGTDALVKSLADMLEGHMDDDNHAHPASGITLVDAGNRISSSTVEGALQELSGEGRTTETVKSVDTKATATANAFLFQHDPAAGFHKPGTYQPFGDQASTQDYWRLAHSFIGDGFPIRLYVRNINPGTPGDEMTLHGVRNLRIVLNAAMTTPGYWYKDDADKAATAIDFGVGGITLLTRSSGLDREWSEDQWNKSGQLEPHILTLGLNMLIADARELWAEADAFCAAAMKIGSSELNRRIDAKEALPTSGMQLGDLCMKADGSLWQYQVDTATSANAWVKIAVINGNGQLEATSLKFGTIRLRSGATLPSGEQTPGDVFVRTTDGAIYKFVEVVGWTELIALDADGRVQASGGFGFGASKPTFTSGAGAKSGTEAGVSSGSLFVRTDAPTGTSGYYVYNTIDGWKQLAVV